MKFLTKILIVATLLQVAQSSLQAADSPDPAAIANSLKSPEVLPDKRVTFRIYAPKATGVSLTGDWVEQGLGKAEDLQKDEQGVWSITIGPLPAESYGYIFTVDGVRTVDPRNALTKGGRIRDVQSLFLLPGPEADFHALRPVPHGSVRIEWYNSPVTGTQRRLHVYVPPGYSDSEQRLPVLYLLHGYGYDDSTWATSGRASFILDNLLAENRAKPMIIVMPDGNLPPPPSFPPLKPGEAPSPEEIDAVHRSYVDEFFKGVIPFVERSYRASSDPKNRAIAGASMGGRITLMIFTKRPDQFSHLGIWMYGPEAPVIADHYKRLDFFKDSDRINSTVKLLEIKVGDKDFALEWAKGLAEILTKHGIKHNFEIRTGGRHTGISARQYLREFAPVLFQQ